jgi:hypothetical protein
MQLRRLTIPEIIFLSTSLFLALFTFYSANVYIMVYETIRHINIPTPELKVIVSNASYAATETKITLQNPSKTRLELIQVMEGIRLNSEFLTSGSLSMQGKPVEIQPMSDVNITIKAEIPHFRIERVTGTQVERMWVIDVRITLSAEIVGIFPWRGSWLINDVFVA